MLLTVLSSAALLLGSAPAVTCRSGEETLYKRGATRVFSVDLRDGSGETIYACSARFRRPRHVGDLDYGGDPRFYAGPRIGSRITLLQFVYSEGGDYGGELGWWDERTGVTRRGDLGTALFERSAIASDGAMAAVYTDVFAEDESLRVGYMCVGRKRLGKLRELAVAADAVPSSLAVTDDFVTWRTRAGEAGSAPRDDRGCR
jgi:hypothetical protein